MKLYIDTSSREKIILGIDDERYEKDGGQKSSRKLLPFIDEVLKKNGKTVKDLTEIEVNVGPGSFTGLRVGVSVANTLGWSLNIPVNGKRLDKGESVDIDYENK